MNSMRFRMMAGFLLVTLLGFIAALISLTQIVQNFLLNERLREQQNVVDNIADSIFYEVKNSQANLLYREILENSRKLGGRILIVDNYGVVQVDAFSSLNGSRLLYDEVRKVIWGGDYNANAIHMLDMPVEGTNQLDSMWQSAFPKKQWVIYYVSSLEREGKNYGAVVMSISAQDVFDQVKEITSRITLVLGVVLIAISIVTYLITKHLTRPIADLTSIIRRISRGEQGLRVTVATSSSEMMELGQTFNLMSERIENTDKFRSEFVSNASHEIKTPLATMKILLESLLYQEKMDEAIAREFLGDINNEIDRLSIVVSDLLKLVQVDRAQADMNKEKLLVNKLCEEVTHRLVPIANKKNIILEKELEKVEALADSLKLDQVIFNLVDNAIKYTDEGGVVRLLLSKDDNDFIIKISDTGIGIPQKDIPHVFERFYRVDKARSRLTGGTGLGLSIVERIVKLHSGEISVESIEGKGTTFIVKIPLN